MNFLIPANTKSGKLILGIFRPFDLILFLTGVFITVIFLAIMPLSSTFVTILVLLPAAFCGFLVIPIPYYHNILNVIVETYQFYTNQRTYIWKGWCARSEKEDK